MSTILGIDISLTGTGVCIMKDGVMQPPRTISPKTKEGIPRLEEVVHLITAAISEAKPNVVAIENLAHGSTNGNPLERAYVNFAVQVFLHHMTKPYMVSPTELKKFAFGSGKAEKSQMILQAYKLSGHTITPADDNQADAMCLAWIGACIAGDRQPANQAQRDIIAAVQNPTKKKRKKKEIA